MLELRAHEGREEPGADDLVCLGAEVHREDAQGEFRVVAAERPAIWGVQRRGRPGVHDVGVSH